MKNDNNEEALDLINRLLERLHQADLKNFGSHLQIVYVASGGQHVDTQINIGAYPQPKASPQPSPKGKGVDSAEALKKLPDVLATDKAMELWEKAQAAGWIDGNYQPLISRTQAALLAFEIAKRLEIKDKWKTFEMLWNRRNMYRDYYDALEQHQSLQFREKLKQLFQ